MSNILEFINRRWSNTDANWLDGNCYWFAHILHTRFPHTTIFYLPESGHFIIGDGTRFYDARGVIEPNETILDFEELLYSDPVWYIRILENCRD